MKFRKISAMILAVIMVVACIAGCGSTAPAGGSADAGKATDAAAQPAGDAANGDVVINVGVGSFATSSVFESKEIFEKDHPGVTINVVEIPFGQLYEKLVTSFATNTDAYDIVIYPSNWMMEFIEGNSIIAIDDYLGTKDNWDTLVGAYKDIAQVDGSTYAVPLDGDSIILYYRKSAFENKEYQAKFKSQYGYELEVPKTWDEYIDCAEFFNGWDWDGDGEIEYGTIEAMGPKDVGGYIFFTHALTYAAHPDFNGYAFFNYETLEPSVNNEAYKRALEEYKSILKFGPPDMINFGGGDERAAFPAGESAMAIDWHDTAVGSQDVTASAIKEDVGYALAPGTYECWNPETKKWDKFDEVQYAPYLAFSGWTSSITSTCQDPQAAADFLNVLDSDEISLKAVTTPGTARNPYREQHMTDYDAWKNSVSEYYNPEEFLEVVQQSYDHPNHQLDMRLPKAGSYLDAMDIAVSQVLSGELDVDKALQNVYDAWEEITDGEGRDSQLKFYQSTYASK